MAKTVQYVISFTLLILISSCSDGNQENGWDEMNLEGRVHTLEQTTYEAKKEFGEFQQGKRVGISRRIRR